jgi:hypothetical protein
MKTFAYLEFFNLDQDAGALSLMEFPKGLLLPADARIKTVYRSAGRKRTISGRTQAEIIDKLKLEPFNSVETEYLFEPYEVGGLDVRIIGMTQGLVLSTTNALWRATATWPEDLPQRLWSERLTLNGQEERLRLFGINSAPNEQATWIQLDGDIDWLAKALTRSVPECFGSDMVCGGGGLFRASMTGEPGEGIVSTSFYQMSKEPERMKRVGERFMVLQPVMVGPIDLCHGLAHALGGLSRLYEVESASGNPTMGVVQVLAEFDARGDVVDPKIVEMASPWLA